MPSAANVKVDKHISPDNAAVDSTAGSTPIRQAITTIEHKIRNLEKRKGKLESYRELQNGGKELNADQKTAVAKYNEVTQTLEFARDLCKQFLSIAVASEKETKKQLKKEAVAKNQAELARLREILLVQDALNQMGNENVREDFLHGRNGAALLTEAEIKLLDDLYPAVTPKHEAGNPTAFSSEIQAAAEHLLAVVDGKPKEVFGGSYSQIKEVLCKIHECGYFTQVQVYEAFVEGSETPATTAGQEVPISGNGNAGELAGQELSEPLMATSLPIEAMPIDVRPPHNVPVLNSMVEVPVPAPLVPPPGPPMELSQVVPPQAQIPQEQVFYQQMPVVEAPLVQQAPQVLRPPITELLNSGNFHFLQDSEIDPTPNDQPPQPPQPIPSQTYTNQNFVTPGGPAPPMPLPTHFLQMNNMTANQPALPNNIPEGVVGGPPGPQIPLQQPLPTNKQKPAPEDLHALNQQQQGPAPPGHHQQPPQRNAHQRINNANNNNSQNSHQSYYQNNNGYSNSHRPRNQQHQPQSHHQQQSHRNGPRSGGGSNATARH